jgi:asparagine synthase (glutamine-hydrolysing)
LPSGRRERRSTTFRAARFLEAAATPRAERYGALMQVFALGERAALWSDDAKHEIGALQSAGLLLGAPPRGGMTGLQLLDVATYLPGDLLPKSDIASMAHSLELRSPLLDPAVLELGLSLPDDRKRRKAALRQAFADELPASVASRGKTGFGVPLAAWFRGELRETAHGLLAADRGWFDRTATQRLLDDHVAGRADNGHRLWTLVMLELWLRAHT